MKVSLLDVNTLVALAWPNHIHHASALQWFASNHGDGWATCPVTESGFVRVSSNPRATSEAKTPGQSLHLLRQIVALPGHTFWKDGISLARTHLVDPVRLLGHRQVTDAHLVALALHRKGRLVTFDRGLQQVLPETLDSDDLLIVLN